VSTATKSKRGKLAAARRKGAPGRHELLSSALPELVQAFGERQLLVYSSATAFRVVSSIVPFLLFGIALLGFLDLSRLWTDHLAAQIRPNVSQAGFTVIDDTVTKVLTQKQLFWLTAGFALAIWQVSSGIRVIMRGLDAIYEAEDTRSWFERFRTSVLLALVVSALVLGATAVVWLGPLAYGGVGQPLGAVLFLTRWLIAAALLGLAVGLVVRWAPDSPQPAGWVSFGTLIMVSAWVVASVLFGLWLKYVSAAGSVFGSLATVVVLIAYIYISTGVFFVGAQVDAIIRERVEGNPQGR
jgi:membrane protein